MLCFLNQPQNKGKKIMRKRRKINYEKKMKFEIFLLRTYPGIPFSMMNAVIPLAPAEGFVFAYTICSKEN